VLFGITFFFVWHSHEATETETRRLTENYGTILEEDVIGYLNKIDLTLLNVVDELHRQLRQGGIKPREIETFLKRQDSYIPETYGLRISNDVGDIIHAVSFVKGANVSIADRQQFIQLRDHSKIGLFIGKPVTGRISLKPAFAMARRYDKPDGSFGGVIFVGVPVEYFIKIFARLDLGEQGGIGLWDKTTLFARYTKTDPESAKNGVTTPSPQHKAYLESGVTHAFYQARSSIDGILRGTHFRKVGEHPLYLIVSLADQDYLAEWRRNTWLVGVLVGLFMVGSIFVARLAYHNITLRRKAEDTMRQLAYRDMLTDLPNRVSLHAALEIAIEAWKVEKTPFAVVMMDLDGFKPVNDTYGHDAGDEVLRVVGARLMKVNRPSDIAARLGGDEFAIVLNGCQNLDVASEIAQRFIDAIFQPIRLRDTDATVKIGASAGVAHITSVDANAEALMKNADSALYLAKSAGKNRVTLFQA
jgi:diguanylate cyclase (GGDEF)-like protein